MSRREREHTSAVPVVIVLLAALTVVALFLRACYEVLRALAWLIHR